MSKVKIRVIDIVYALMKRWGMILTLAIAGAMLGLLMSTISYVQSINQNSYVWCNVAVTAQTESGSYSEGKTVPALNDNSLAVDMTEAVMYVITSYGVREEAIAEAGLSDSVDPNTLSTYLTVSRYNETQIIGLTLQWDDPDEGERLMQALVDVAEQTVESAFGIGMLAEIDGPGVFYSASVGRSTFIKNAGMIGALGALVGLGVALLELVLRPTLLDLKDVEKVLKQETVGVIPKDNAYFSRKSDLLVRSDDDEVSVVERNYSAAAHILRNMMGTKNKRSCFYVTSAEDGEGKTTVAVNLAIQLSDMGKRVLLIDLDTRKPSLGGLFLDAVDYSRSLNALYKGEATVQEAINSLTGTLDFLPLVLERAGIPLDETLFELIEQLSADYQYVIIDAPSMGKSSDVLNLNRLAHMVLFVIHHDMSPIQDIQEALTTLDKSGIRILGCVVNAYQAIELKGLLGNSKKEEQTKVKRKRTDDKEHTKEINELVMHEDMDGSAFEFPSGVASPVKGDILAEVSERRTDEDSQLTTEDVLESLIKMGMDGSWSEVDADAPHTAGDILEDSMRPEEDEIEP